MADLSSYTSIIISASPGEDVRDALINILKLLNNIGGDVSNFNGHPSSYFAKYSELIEIQNKINDTLGSSMRNDDAVPTNEGDERFHVLTSGQIYKAVSAISDILEDINHPLSPIDDLMKNIEAVESAKRAIGNAIYNRNGGKLTRTQRKNFEMYPHYISLITSGLNIEQITLDARENTKPDEPYEANEGNESYDRVKVYKKANVNVSFDLNTLSTTYNDTYKVEEGFAGYKEVRMSQSSTSSGGGRSGGGSGANNIDENGIIDSVTIEENGLHSPSNGVGWRSVNVDVKDPNIDFDALFEVNFYDCDPSTGEKTGSPIDTQHCNYNGSCVFAGEEPTHTGLYFSGWNPPPYRIHADTDCVAVFTDQAPSEDEIEDSWDDIIACQGSIYPVGAYKTLQLNSMNAIRMQKVYVCEDVSTSTWLAMDMLSSVKTFNNNRHSDYINGTGRAGWSGSDIRQWLNNTFLYNNIPENLRSAIVEVKKTSYEFSYDTASMYISSVKDKIWMPSFKEIMGDVTNNLLTSVTNAQYDALVNTQSFNFADNGFKNEGIRVYTGTSRIDSYITEYNGIHYTGYPSFDDDISHDPKIDKGTDRYYGWTTRSICTIRRSRNGNALSAFARCFVNQNMLAWEMQDVNAEDSYDGYNKYQFRPVIGFCL